MVDEKPRVLVVDDAKANVQVLSGMLKERYRVSFALDGARALEIAGSDRRPDVILLDVHMPEMDGFEVVEHLKSDAATREIPVAFVSGSDAPEDEAVGRRLGAVGFLRKPVDPDALNTLLIEILGPGERTPDGSAT
jgi:putative two-component system response regulator